MIGIYKITSPSNKVYIGQSIDVENRLKRYKYFVSKKQTRLYYSILKYGYDNHTYEVVEECKVEELNERERYWQDFYDCLNNGLNCRLTTTKDISGYVSEETKEKQRQAKLGTNRTEITKQKISTARLGMKFSKKVKANMKLAQQNRNYKHSEETLIKLSKAKKGKKGKEANNIRPIIDLSTNIEYSCIQEASEKLNIKYPKLYYHVRKGIKFKYK